MSDYSCWLISNRVELLPVIQQNLLPEKLNFFDGTGIGSFSRLVNQCVVQSPTECVIMMSHKVRPIQQDVQKTLELLERGYAFVGLRLFRFFGFRKELFRQIGCFDERFIGGGFEDYDLIVRMIEHNLAFYTEETVPWIDEPSSWTINGHYPGYDHWCKKWQHHWNPPSHIPTKLERTVSEERYQHYVDKLGPSTGWKFLTGRENSYNTNYPHVSAFYNMQIVSSAQMRYTRI